MEYKPTQMHEALKMKSSERTRGMLHSQLIGEQMKRAHELREDTAQK